MSVPKIGEIVENFKILKDLGKGGMGQVYLAIDQKLSRKVALKFLGHGNQDTPPNIMARFEKEAKALATFSHPNIVNIHFFGSYKGTSYLVMEYVEGGTLADIIQVGSFGVEETIQAMKEVLLGLGEAHKKGILHRDVKPENLLLSTEGKVKIVDFGICKDLDETGERITKENLLIGTASYMSPESIQHGDSTPASDIFSLGVVFYELIVGVHPFIGNSAASRMIRICNDPIKFPRDFYDMVPSGLPSLIEKMTALDVQDRYQNTNSVLHDLENLEDVVIPSFQSVEFEKDGLFNDLDEAQDSLLMGGYDLEEAEKIIEAAQVIEENEDSLEMERQVAAIMAGTINTSSYGEESFRDRTEPISKKKVAMAQAGYEKSRKKFVMPEFHGKKSLLDNLKQGLGPVGQPKILVLTAVAVVALVGWSQRDQLKPLYLEKTGALSSVMGDIKRSIASVPEPTRETLEKGRLIKIRRVRENPQTEKTFFEVVDELKIVSVSGDIIFSKLKDGETQTESVVQFARNPFLPPLRKVAKGHFDKKSVIVQSSKDVLPLKVGKTFDFLYNTTENGRETQYSRNCEVKLRESIQDTEVFKVTCTTRSRGREQVSDIFYSPKHNLILREVRLIRENGQTFKETHEVIGI